MSKPPMQASTKQALSSLNSIDTRLLGNEEQDILFLILIFGAFSLNISCDAGTYVTNKTGW